MIHSQCMCAIRYSHGAAAAAAAAPGQRRQERGRWRKSTEQTKMTWSELTKVNFPDELMVSHWKGQIWYFDALRVFVCVCASSIVSQTTSAFLCATLLEPFFPLRAFSVYAFQTVDQRKCYFDDRLYHANALETNALLRGGISKSEVEKIWGTPYSFIWARKKKRLADWCKQRRFKFLPLLYECHRMIWIYETEKDVNKKAKEKWCLYRWLQSVGATPGSAVAIWMWTQQAQAHFLLLMTDVNAPKSGTLPMKVHQIQMLHW